MPPSPRIKAAVNEQRYAALCKEMGLTRPPLVRILPGKQIGNRRTHGSINYASWTITLNVGVDADAIERLRFIQSEAVATLLHELRHAYQYMTWTPEKQAKAAKGDYFDREEEADAEGFARTHQHQWVNLVRIRRVQHGSGFSKLARHDSRRIV